MAERFLCAMCDRPEESCQCIRCCAICQNPDGVRLVGDGLWYCYDCREACDYKSEDQVTS